MTTVQPATQQYNYSGVSGNSGTNSNSSSIAQDLEQVFTKLASAVESSGQGSATEPSAVSSVVQGLAQALDGIITQVTGQNVNLDALLNNSSGTGSVSNTGTVGNTGTSGSVNTVGSASTNAGTALGTAGIGTSTGTSLSTAGVTGVSVSGNGGLSENQLYGYIVTALSQNGNASENGLSGPQNLAYWNPSTASGKANLDSFYNGVVAAHSQFFPNVPMSTFAQAVVAEAGAESTLNPTAGGGGLLQVTSADAVNDYNNHGAAIKDANGNTVMSPGQSWNSNNPETNVLMWAWYNKNCVAEGGVAPNNWGKGQSNGVSNTYGSVFANWLGGPGDKLGEGTDYYVNRIQQFFEKIGGSSEDFNNLLNTQLTSGTVAVS